MRLPGGPRNGLTDSSQRLRALVDASPLAIVELDLCGRVRLWSSAAERLYGWTSAEVIGQILPSIPPELRGEHETLLERLRAGETFTDVETVRLRKDGTRISVSVSAAPILDRNGGVAAITSVAADITERRQLEERLHHAQKMETLGQLAGGVAHDFNNVLTAIRGHAELAIARPPGDERARASLAEIVASADRARALTQELLTFGRRQVLQPELVDVNECVRSIGRLLERLIRADVEVELALHEPLGAVVADGPLLERAILNLALNARDAMPEGGLLTVSTANVDLEASPAGAVWPLQRGRYVVAVADTGHGIADDARPHIFDPFFTTKPPGVGTGLGLATVYGVAEATGGGIAVETAPDRGTTFRVYLPRSDLSPLPASVGERVTGPRARHSETILLVEDDAGVRAVVREALTDAGYRVLEADKPADAVIVARAHEGPIDLLLADVVMPGMSGLRLSRALAHSRSGMRTLYMSGYAPSLLARDVLLDAGAPFVQKPFAFATLLERVREVLETDE